MKLQGIIGVVLTIVIISIVLGIGSQVLSGVKDTQYTSTSITRENITITNGTNAILAYRSADNSNVAPIFCWGNASISTVTSGTNYTLSRSTLTYVNLHPAQFAVATCNYTYSDCSNVACNSSTYGLIANETLSRWLPTIVLVIILALIVGIIMTYLFAKVQTKI